VYSVCYARRFEAGYDGGWDDVGVVGVYNTTGARSADVRYYRTL